MTQTIKFPFGKLDVQELVPTTGHTVTFTVDNTGTFVKIGKLASNTTINAVAADGLEKGASLTVYTFNVKGETHNTVWGTGFYGTNISGVDNKAHYSTFMYDGDRFVQTGNQVSARNELETVSAAMDVSVDGNIVTWVTTYTNEGDVPDEWVLDVILDFSNPIPVGTKITITGLSGEYEVETTAKSKLWLSDVMKGHSGDPSTRGKLNLHSAPVTFVATLSELPVAKLDLTIQTTLVTSNTTTEGSYEADEAMTNINVLARDISNVSLVED